VPDIERTSDVEVPVQYSPAINRLTNDIIIKAEMLHAVLKEMGADVVTVQRHGVIVKIFKKGEK